jgi:hypothetical protein
MLRASVRLSNSSLAMLVSLIVTAANHCLYCPAAPKSVEHPLPAAFGEFDNAPLLYHRICRECNRRLGKLDEQFARSSPEGFLRQFYGIKGRPPKGDPVNPFLRGSAGGRRLEMKSYDRNLGMDVLLAIENGVLRHLPQVIFVKDDQAHHVPLNKDTTPDELRESYNQLGIAQPEKVHFVCDKEEMAWVEPLLVAAWPVVINEPKGETATTYNGATVDITLTNRYFRAVAKIAFHYFLTQFSRFTGHELMFDRIRAYILDDAHKVDRANDYIGERQFPLVGEMLSIGSRPQGWKGHVLAGEIKNGRCLAHVQMFLSEDYPARTYTVTLASEADAPESGRGHLYAYYEGGLQGKYAGTTLPLTWTRVTVPTQGLRPVISMTEA